MDSPTLCRPNQIEIEKLRTCLSSKEFQGIRYHEAVLFKGEKMTAACAYKLLVITNEGVKFFALTHLGKKPIRIKFSQLLDITREPNGVGKFQHPLATSTSEVIRIVSSDQEYFICVFEPCTKVRYFLKKVWQNAIAISTFNISRSFLKPNTARSLFNELQQDVMNAETHREKRQLLLELSEALRTDFELKKLFFQSEVRRQEHGTISWIGYLFQELLKYREPKEKENRLDTLLYVESILTLLYSALFDSLTVPDRFAFVSHNSYDISTVFELFIQDYRIDDHASSDEEDEKTSTEGESIARISRQDYLTQSQRRIVALVNDLGMTDSETDCSRVRKHILDLQGLILYELDHLVCEAHLLQRPGFPHNVGVSQHLATQPEMNRWFARFIKRFCEKFTACLESLSQMEDTGPSLRLLQYSNTLYMFLVGDFRLREQMKEENDEALNFFIRNPDFCARLNAVPYIETTQTLKQLKEIEKICSDVEYLVDSTATLAI